MGKVFALLLIAVGVYVGLTVYDEGVDRAFGGLFARSSASTTQAAVPLERDDPGAADRAADARIARESSPGSYRAGAVTTRVRERVTGAVDEGSRRAGGR